MQLKKIEKIWQIWQNSKSWFVYFTETEKDRAGNELKIIPYVQTWPPDVKNEILKKSTVLGMFNH